ncbi:UNVERIFIED_CONTAM: hypothetical protein RMT77_019034 [Armadillidium vulgare]
MKTFLNCSTLFCISLSLIVIENASANPLRDFVDLIMKQLMRREKTKNNNFDDSVVYAIPSPDGQGFILQGYGKPYDPYAYDNNVDIRQTKKMWSGQVKIPNFFPKEGYLPDRTIKGNDNRIGMRVSIPFVGDFQYLREIGPGRFTDNLGPGAFPYPGFNDKQKHHQKPYYDPNYYGQDVYGNSYPDPYAEPPHHHDHHSDELYTSSSEQDLQYISPDQKAEADDSLNIKPQSDPYKGLKNYPWFRK